MKAAVIGSGASIEAAIQAGVEPRHYPPTIGNFAEKLWCDPEAIGFQNYWVADYLRTLDLPLSSDPTDDFVNYERIYPQVTLEKLLEYCWHHKGNKFEDDYKNLLYHGITNPLNDLLIRGFFINGVGIRNLEAGQSFAQQLSDGDLVLDLNYDTLFEVAAEQAGVSITYIPNPYPGDGLVVSKPHGSLNLLADDEKFWFAQSNCIGALPSSADGFRNYNSIVPPRFNKSYNEHPIAQRILKDTRIFSPKRIIFWGVGLAESDYDLIDLYGHWSRSATSAEVINPDSRVCGRAKEILDMPVTHYRKLHDWLNG